MHPEQAQTKAFFIKQVTLWPPFFNYRRLDKFTRVLPYPHDFAFRRGENLVFFTLQLYYSWRSGNLHIVHMPQIKTEAPINFIFVLLRLISYSPSKFYSWPITSMGSNLEKQFPIFSSPMAYAGYQFDITSTRSFDLNQSGRINRPSLI